MREAILGQTEGVDPDEARIKGFLITDYRGLSKNSKSRFIPHIWGVQGGDTIAFGPVVSFFHLHIAAEARIGGSLLLTPVSKVKCL